MQRHSRGANRHGLGIRFLFGTALLLTITIGQLHAQTCPLKIGSIAAPRSGFAIETAPYFEQFRSLLGSNFDLSFVGLPDLLAPEMADLDLLVLQANEFPPQAGELAALMTFIQDGGTVLMNPAPHAASQEPNSDLWLAPLSLDMIPATSSSSVVTFPVITSTDPDVAAIVNGSFGPVLNFRNRYVGSFQPTGVSTFEDVGVVSLAGGGNPNESVLSLVPRGTYGTGQVLIVTNFHVFIDPEDITGGLMDTQDSQVLLLNLVDSATESCSPVGPTPYQDAVLADSPVSYWSFEETSGTIIHDQQGLNDGTLVGAPILDQPGSPGGGRSIQFASGGFVDIANDPSITFTDTFSIEMWINPTNLTNQMYIVDKNYDEYSVILGYQPGNTNFFQSGYINGGVASQLPVSIGNWHHVVYVKDANGLADNWRGYLNGCEFFVETANFTLTPNPNGNGDLHLGSSRNFFNYLGYLDEVAVYDYALSAGSVSAHYEAATGMVCPLDAPPIADAGMDFTALEGQSAVTLDGTASNDPDSDPLDYQWTQLSGTLVTLSGNTTAQPAFDAPIVGVAGEILTFELAVTANGVTVTDTVDVGIMDTAVADLSEVSADPEIISAFGGLSTITVTPRNLSGDIVGPGALVTLTTTGGTLLGSPVDQGDGTYTQDLEGVLGTPFGQVSAIANGALLDTMLIVSFVEVDPDLSTITVDDGTAFLGAIRTVTVTPRDDFGALLGTGLQVVIDTTVGDLIGSPSDNGDGTYTQTIEATMLGTAAITATVDLLPLAVSASLTITDPATLGDVIGAEADETLHVYASIQEAVNSVTADNLVAIYIAPGIYAETVKIKNLSGLTIEGLSATDPVIVDGLKLVSSQDITIQYLEVDAQYSCRHGVIIRGRCAANSNVTLSGLYVHNAPHNRQGVVVRRNNSNVTIADCTISDNGRNGIALRREGGDHLVIGCTISNNGRNGIRVGRNVTVSIEWNTIVNNGTASGNGGGRYGVLRQRACNGGQPENITLIQNVFSGNCGKVVNNKSDTDLRNYDQIIDATDDQPGYLPM